MSQSFTSRILDNQSNKLLANLPSIEINNGPVQPIPVQMSNQLVQLGEEVQESKTIKFFGFEFTIYTLILLVILIACVGYFLYKYFFTKSDLVVYKKNLKKDLKKNKEKNKDELSNASSASNLSDSSSTQTLDL
jgi:hypothetical protein